MTLWQTPIARLESRMRPRKVQKRMLSRLAVGYARRQSKSNWNFGPRKTPISCAVIKVIIKDKRKMRKEKQQNDCESEQQKVESTQEEQEICKPDAKEEPSYVETVQEIKRRRKQEKRKQQ